MLIGTGHDVNNYLIKYLLAFSLIYFLYLIAKKIPDKNRTLSKVASYSFQLMLLDSFLKIVLYKIFRNVFIGEGIDIMIIVCAIPAIDLLLGVVTCGVVKKVPIVNILFGLQK